MKVLHKLHSFYSYNFLKRYPTQKMKILSSFAHPQIVSNLYEFISSAEHNGRYFEERLEPNSCLVSLTYIVGKKNTMEVNGVKVPIILQNIFLSVQQNK